MIAPRDTAIVRTGGVVLMARCVPVMAIVHRRAKTIVAVAALARGAIIAPRTVIAVGGAWFIADVATVVPPERFACPATGVPRVGR
jgi:hypothetical protein